MQAGGVWYNWGNPPCLPQGWASGERCLQHRSVRESRQHTTTMVEGNRLVPVTPSIP